MGHVRFATFIALIGLTGCAATDLPPPSDPRAVNTGAFPTFAAVPAAANVQLPAAEADRAIMALEDEAVAVNAEPRPMGVEARIAQAEVAGARAQANAPRPMSFLERLRRLGETHDEETLRRIENSGRSS